MQSADLNDNNKENVLSEAMKLAGQGHNCLEIVFSSLPNTQEINWVVDKLLALKHITKKDVMSEKQKQQTLNSLDGNPQTATEFVELYIAKHKITANAKGDLKTASLPVLQGIQVTAEQMASSKLVSQAVKKEQNSLTRSELLEEMELLHEELKLGYRFNARLISHALTKWLKAQKRDAWTETLASVMYDGPSALDIENIRLTQDPNYRTGAAEWRKLVNAAIDTKKTDPLVAELALRKFVWQVKRKMVDLPVTNHLMLVLLGPQGFGKSSFVEKLLCKPMENFIVNTTFTEMTDGRNIGLYKNYILFLDEMSHATKADMDMVKKNITLDRDTKRVMGSNHSDTFKNEATFIGCSNKELNQLITDETGIRRFLGLYFSTEKNWDVLNTVDVHKLWTSVDEEGPDPSLPVMQEIKALQDACRSQSSVEEWALSLEREEWPTNGKNCKNAFQHYAGWAETFASKRSLDMRSFKNEMARLINYSTDENPFPLEKGDTRSNQGFTYKWRL